VVDIAQNEAVRIDPEEEEVDIHRNPTGSSLAWYMYMAHFQVMDLVVSKPAVHKPAVAHIAMPAIAVAIVVALDTDPAVDLHGYSRHIHQQAHPQNQAHAFW
jgi:hypothetical protein